MKKIALCAALALVPVTAALAQPAPVLRNTGVGQIDAGDNSGPGSVGYFTPSGRAEDRRSDNAGAAGNTNLPERPIPNTGGQGDTGGGN